MNKINNLKKRLQDLWFDLTYYYPHRIRDVWWSTRCIFRNARRYRKILLSDCDFDHGYLEDLLLTKLSFMAEYFKTSRIAVGEERYYSQINLVLRVGKVAFEKDEDPENYGGDYGLDYLGYVNTRNQRRFWPSLGEEATAFKTELRRVKARYLFYRILSQYSQEWWD